MISEALLAATEDDIISVAMHLDLRIPSDADTVPEVQDPGKVNAYSIDPYTELVAAETALRQAVRLILGDKWKSDFSVDDLAKLENKQREEDKRRDGVTVSSDLLDYTETYHLKKMIDKHWVEFKPIFDDKARTSVYFDTILDIRNTIAHSRPVVPAERLLIAGAAGQLQNQLARFRSQVDGPAAHYASINYVRDSFGNELRDSGRGTTNQNGRTLRLSVGDHIFFECSASDPRGREVGWRFSRSSRGGSQLIDEQLGHTATFEWVVSEDDVGESRQYSFIIRNKSRFQRHMWGDDSRYAEYHVNPPLD
jgi:hypothetical protein